jgi:hypothetical protein
MKLSCPQCGGTNEAASTATFIKCEFCKNSLLIDWDTIRTVFSFKPSIEANKLDAHLEQGLKKNGFTEKVEIFDAVPVYLPFLLPEGNHRPGILLNGSSRFPETEIPTLHDEKINFNAAGIKEKNIEIVPICSRPEGTDTKIIYYIPFFHVNVRFNEQEFAFFINAVNGDINGDPIPYTASGVTSKLFPLFIGVFVLLLLINSIFNYMPLVILLCLAAMYIVHRAANRWLEKGELKP